MSYNDMVNMNVNLNFHEDLGSDDSRHDGEASDDPRVDDEIEGRPAEAHDGTQATKWTEGDHTVDTAKQRGKSSGVVALALLQTYVSYPPPRLGSSSTSHRPTSPDGVL